MRDCRRRDCRMRDCRSRDCRRRDCKRRFYRRRDFRGMDVWSRKALFMVGLSMDYFLFFVVGWSVLATPYIPVPLWPYLANQLY